MRRPALPFLGSHLLPIEEGLFGVYHEKRAHLGTSHGTFLRAWHYMADG